MAKFPYLTGRKGTQNLYYKRPVPFDLRGDGRPNQIWRSLKTADHDKAKRAYAVTHAEVELLFAGWRKADAAGVSPIAPSAPELPVTPLTPSLLKRLSDAHYLGTCEADFQWRGELWRKAHEDEEAFWRGEIIKHPVDDWQQVKGQSYSYYAHLMGEPELEPVFLYCVFAARKERLERLRRQHRLGDTAPCQPAADALLAGQGMALSESDRSRLCQRLMEVEIKALEDLTAGDESTFDGIVARQAHEPVTPDQKPPAKPGEKMSALVEKYLSDTAREREWPKKTALRKSGELREFIEVVGDRPVNGYRQEDGVKFKDVQLALPVNRQKAPFRGLSIVAAAKKATKLRDGGEAITPLSPLTIKDKIGTISLFFVWAKSRDASVVNPVADQKIRTTKKRGRGKKRHPWTIEELNKMFAAPVYTGCRSEYYWQQPGNQVLRQSAKFWVPLIGLFSGMRLGEIVQLQAADVKLLEGIHYFDVTPVAADTDEDGDEDEKSLKTSSSRRGIPIHKTLFEIGFAEFLEFRRGSGATRLFPEFERAKDDNSWSKAFGKHFKRFRDSIGVTRRGVDFHSLRHNMEDALRNAGDVRKEIRDAIQGHGESGVAREYGTGYYIKTLNEAVQKISYEGLNLDHLTTGGHKQPKVMSKSTSHMPV